MGDDERTRRPPELRSDRGDRPADDAIVLHDREDEQGGQREPPAVLPPPTRARDRRRSAARRRNRPTPAKQLQRARGREAPPLLFGPGREQEKIETELMSIFYYFFQACH